MEAAVGALGAAFPRKHAGRILTRALEREDARCEGEEAGEVFQESIPQALAGILGTREGNLRNLEAGKRFGMQRDGKVASSDRVGEFVGAVLPGQLIPSLQDGFRSVVESLPPAGRHLGQAILQVLAVFGIPFRYLIQGALGLAPLAGKADLLFSLRAIVTARIGNVAEVTLPLWWNERLGIRLEFRYRLWRICGRCPAKFEPRIQRIQQREIQIADPLIVEVRCHSRKDRHVLRRGVEGAAVALHGLAHIPEGILATPLLELVERHEVGSVQHADLFELRRRTELLRHDIEGQVRHVGNLGVALADAGRLEDDQIVSGGLAYRNGVAQGLACGSVGLTCGQRAHVDALAGLVVDAVHPDAVPEEGASGGAAGGVDGQDSNVQVVKVGNEASDQFIRQRGFSCTARTRDADGGNAAVHVRGTITPRTFHLDTTDAARHLLYLLGVVRKVESGHIEIALADHEIDHAPQAQLEAVFGREDPGHTVGMQFLDFLGHDDTPTTTVDPDMLCTALLQQVDHVREVLHVSPLVGGDSNALGIFVDGRVDDFLDRSVVAEVDDLGTGRLQYPSHDVDGRVVPIKQAGCGYEPDGMDRDIPGVGTFSGSAFWRTGQRSGRLGSGNGHESVG